MRSKERECRRAQGDLLRRDDLDAVRRGRLMLHLKRCEACRAAAEELAQIESAITEIPPMPEERSRQIYDNLVPAVYQIAVDLAPAPRRPARYPLSLALGFGLSAVAAVVLVTLVAYRSFPVSSVPVASDPKGPQAVTGRTFGRLSGLVDRSEGDVRVDGVPISRGDGTIAVQKGTAIQVADGARLSFRIGDAARVALVGAARWRVENASDTAIEVMLERGRIAVEFDGMRGRSLDVRTPDSMVRVRGTLFTVEVSREGGTQVAVIEGRVEVVPLKGGSALVEVGAGEQVSIPGDETPRALSDEQRALASEVDALEDGFVAAAGRLVRFDGSPERVMVEVEGRVLGYTPLAVRLPEGPIDYRLSAPGMEPMSASLSGEQGSEDVRVGLAPAAEYRAGIASDAAVRRQDPSKKGRAEGKDSGEASRWGLVERSRAAMVAGDIPFAVSLLERAVRELDGERLVTASSMLAECYSATGEYRKAADAFDRVASLVPGSKVAQNSRYEVGRLAMERLGDFGRARAAFTAYVASPLGGELKEAAYFSLCEINGREGAHKDALYCFNNFLRTFPGGFYAPNARLWRGALYQDVLRRFGDAELDLLAFIQAKPRHPRVDEARYRVALGRYQLGDQRGALRMIEEYQRETPGGQYALRIERLRRAILDPDFSLDLESK
jgi:TolA-binding protein